MIQYIHAIYQSHLTCRQFRSAVRVLMPNSVTKDRFDYIMALLELIVFDSSSTQRLKLSQIGFQVFLLVASVARRINDVELTVGALIDALLPGSMQSELSRAKRLFFMHVSGTSKHTMDLADLSLELKAGGFTLEAEANIIMKLQERGLEELNLLDFLAYCPLFLGMHDSIVRNPFDVRVE